MVGSKDELSRYINAQTPDDVRQKLNSWQPPSSAPGIHVAKPVINWEEKGRK